MIVFIKTHRRPDKQYTYNALREAGYGDDIIFVVDTEDPTRYDLPFDDRTDVVVFSKQAVMSITDSGEAHPRRNVNLYAWQACEIIAKAMDIDEFIMADDDITGFRYRYVEDGHLKSLPVTKNLGVVFRTYFEWMRDKNICATSLADVRMFIGGAIHESRAVYNFVFRNRAVTLEWKSNMYEETSTAIDAGKEGKYLYQLPFIQFNMKAIDNKETGGMKEIYDSLSIYKRACYPKMFNPSCIEFANNGVGFKLKSDNAFPKLVSSSCKKK